MSEPFFNFQQGSISTPPYNHQDLSVYQDPFYSNPYNSSQLPVPVIDTVVQAINATKVFLSELSGNSQKDYIMGTAFGLYNQESANPILTDWAQNNFTGTPHIELVFGQNFNGAYAKDNDTIYLSGEFLAANLGNVEAVTGVLVEEVGHYLDNQINVVDAAGDEGYIWSKLLRGQSISPGEFVLLKGEDDHGVFVIDGLSIEIEKNVTFYEHSNFGGAKITYGTGSYELRDNWWNDKISSLSIPKGWIVRGYEHSDFSGQEVVWNSSSDTRYVGDGWNDKISSLRVYQPDIVSGNKVDFNGDGKTDFIRQEKGAFANDAARMLETSLSNGDGSFKTAWVSQESHRGMHGDLTNLLMGDFNGDGKTDFLRQEKGAFASDNFWVLETFLSNGDGSFISSSAMHDAAMNGDFTNLFVGDFNGDGKSDFIRQEKGAFANDAARMLETYLSNGNGTFTKAWVSQESHRGMHGDLTNLFMGDFNGDGKTDFLRQEKGAFASDNLWVLETFLSNGDGSFTSSSAMHDAAMNGDFTNLFVGDFNGDGKSDFIRQEKGAFANDAARMLETYLSNGNGTFTKAWVSQESHRGMHGDLTNLLMGDFNGDGKTDFLRQEKGAFASDNLWVLETFLSNGDGSFISSSAMHDAAMNGDFTNLFVGDFDGNGRADFLRQEKGAFASDNLRMLETYTSNSNGSFTKRWQVDDHAMHGDLTNLFTNNESRYQANRTGAIVTPQPSGLMTTSTNLTKLINGDFNGKYIEADGAYLYQCVDLVKDMTDTETTVTQKWKRGENVIQNRNVAVGTAIATFKGSNNSYYGHTAIFGGYDTVNNVFGFWAWSQNFPTGSAVRKHFVPITGSGSVNNDADEYFVIKL